jgi:hypothetical protein
MTGAERAERRVATLAWMARTGAVTARALALRAGCAEAEARARLAALARAGFAVRCAPLRDAPPLYTVTRRGLRACGAGGQPPAGVTPAAAVHAAVCAEVAVHLAARCPRAEVVGEQPMRRREGGGRPSLSCAAGGLTATGLPATHRADLAVLRGGPPLVVEVELTVKAPARLARICRAWARCGTVAGVLYLVSASAREPVSRAVGREGAGPRIAVVGLSSLGIAEPGR